MVKRKKKFGERAKYLYEWIEESELFDGYSRFLSFCESEGYSQTDIISETDFLVLQEKYKS